MSKKQLALSFIILLCIAVAAVLGVRNRLTYLEYSDIARDSGPRSTINIRDSSDVLLQDFVMPYDIVHGLSVQIGTFRRDNNSEWDVAIINPETKEVYCSKHFNGSLAVDNKYLYLEFGRNIRLVKNERYQIRVSAGKVTADTSLAYYVSKGASDNLSLNVGGRSYDGTLCIKVYGGDADSWWCGFVILLSIILFQLLVRICHVTGMGNGKWLQDTRIQAYLVGIVCFLLLVSFCTSRLFGDETDNMLGGLLISHGGVLYRDYVAQHPPFAYYLCGLFALFGAKSVEQFRLCYYLAVSVIWGLLYIRHKPLFGMKMLFLPVIEIIVINSMQLAIPYSGCMVLSDCVQGVCYVALLLEFFKFCREKTLNWGRSFIVSACVWASMGSAFLSAYVLVWIVIAFMAVEFRKWKAEGISLPGFINRYWKLLTALVIPLLLGTAYFALNNSLTRAFDQFYLFNREVYVNYNSLGKSAFALFVLASRNFFDAIVNNFNDLMNAKAEPTKVLHLILLISAASILLCMLKKRLYLQSAVLFAVLCCAGVRGFASFHSIGAWHVAIMIIVLFYDELIDSVRKVAAPVLVVVCVYSMGIFVHSIGDNLLSGPKVVTDFDQYVINLTNDGDELLVDSYRFNSMYYMYKKRSIVNRAQYILPWYMDWYEQDTVDDLLEHRPQYVLFNQDSDVWKRKYFANVFLKTLKQNYTQLADKPAGGWKYYIWKKKDNE
jgi:hypothetical protein